MATRLSFSGISKESPSSRVKLARDVGALSARSKFRRTLSLFRRFKDAWEILPGHGGDHDRRGGDDDALDDPVAAHVFGCPLCGSPGTWWFRGWASSPIMGILSGRSRLWRPEFRGFRCVGCGGWNRGDWPHWYGAFAPHGVGAPRGRCGGPRAYRGGPCGPAVGLAVRGRSFLIWRN